LATAASPSIPVARRVFDHLGQPLDEWHPLENRPAPVYVPQFWIGPHVGFRLVEALRTVQRMPMSFGPKAWGNGWPEIEREYSDYVQYADDAQWKLDQTAEFNRIRPKPSREDITRMEVAIVWPARYLRELPQLLRTVQMVAVVRMRHGHIERAARRLGLPGRLARRWNREGLDTIATGLRRDCVRVF
jgi:hypothetical protein